MPQKAGKPVVRRKIVRKEENLHIRLTKPQKAAIEKAAAKAGLGASSWLLMLALREVERAGENDGG